MKKILSIAGIVCFSMLVAVGTHGIYSWFTDQSQRVNSFSVGMNEVEIREEFPDQELTPGKIIKKEAGFTNTGMVPMYVRAVYLFSNKEAEEGSELLRGSTLWEKADDGYYYYKKIVQPQESTELFLKGIHWKKQKITDGFDLTIYTETVQAAGHSSAKEAFAQMMERQETGKISALLCGLLLIGISGIYGLPKAYVLYQANSGKVAIHLEEYRMNGEKEVPWETEENVLPGGLISKIPRIVNDGADCYVRAKIVFTSEETSDQPLSADNLEGIGSEWVQDGEYFYCKEVVKSGESVDFFRGIRLPAEWKESPEAENRWQASVRAEAVQAECFFPDFSDSDPWGMKTKQFVIRQAMEGEAEEQDGDKDQMELVIASDLQGFTMEQEGCMKQLETFMPGKSQSGKVVIRNGADHKREVFFRAEAPQMTPLLEKMELTVQVREKDQIQILYQGTVTETMLKQNQSLGEILPGKDKQVEFLFFLPEEADNVYAAQTGQVKFWFTTGAPQKTQIVKVAKTGDSQYPGRYLITGIAGAVLAVVVLGKESIRKKGIKSR